MAAVEIPLNPAVLEWALADAGLDEGQLSARSKLPAESIEEWLAGSARPNTTQFRALCRALNRPTAFFLRTDVPAGGTPAQFRTYPEQSRAAETRPLSKEEDKALRAARRFQAVSRWLRDEKVSLLPQVERDAQPSAAEARLAEVIDWSVDRQVRATSSGAVLSSLRAELENLGLLVMLFPMKEDGCRGFSLFDESVPVAVVNSAQTAEARIYTLLHEVGHLMRGESTFDTRFNDPRRIERWCDRFAAEFLLPATDLRSYVEKRFGSLVDDLETARSVGRRFKTSLTATCIRLEELGLASTPLIGQIPRREHLKPRSDEEDGFNPDPSTAGKRLREYGESIVRDIFEAERDGRLSRLDVQRYLSLSDEKYPELRGRVDEAFTDPSSS